MTHTAPNHYSYKFKFDIEKLPTSQKDRIPSLLAVWGIVFGLVFTALGLFEFISCFFEPAPTNYNFDLPQTFSGQDIQFHRYLFDVLLLLLGVLITGLSAAAMMRYKKIFFDGDKIRIIHRPLFGEKQIEEENLFNYLGVLLKVEHYQLGLINRNRYIIELYHKEQNKRVPLYISTSGRNVRKTWEYYAEKLKMPALFMTDHGLISRHYTELNKTLKDMAKKWQLKSLYHNDEDMPDSIKYTIKKNKVIVKEKRLFFDAYSFLAFLGAVFLLFLMVAAVIFYKDAIRLTGVWGYAVLQTLLTTTVVLSLINIFSKDVLVITNRDIILGHNVLFLRVDAEFLPKHRIESVDIGHNPVTDRYYLSVISDERNMVFGKNMPVNDLRWVRGFMIREIIKSNKPEK